LSMLVKVSTGRGWDEVDLYCELHGCGPQKILFIMGLLSPCRHWGHQIEFFSKLPEYQLCVFDNRGAGKSSVPRTNYRTSDMAQDALELVDYLKWEKFHLVGLSMGGMIALELSVIASQRIQSLTLAVTHAGALAPLAGTLAIVKSGAHFGMDRKAAVMIPALYSKEFLVKQHKDGGPMLSSITQRFLLNREGKEPHPFAIIGHLRAVITHRVSPQRLNILKMPILIVTGTMDDMVDPSNSDKLHAMLPGSRLVLFQGAGHLINEECAEDFNAACLDNFRRGAGT